MLAEDEDAFAEACHVDIQDYRYIYKDDIDEDNIDDEYEYEYDDKYEYKYDDDDNSDETDD